MSKAAQTTVEEAVAKSSLREVPKTAKRFARKIARGATFEQACLEAKVKPRDARMYMRANWWKVLVKKYFMTKDEVEDAIDSLVPLSIKSLANTLRNSIDEKERNGVAKEILKMRGYSSLEKQAQVVHIHTPDFVEATIKTYNEMKSKKKKGKGKK